MGVAGDLANPQVHVTRAVRLTPSDERAAPLTFVFTPFPSVMVHAGALQDFLFPSCGCDACDESWQGCAEEMEWQVQAVADGRYTERISRGFRTYAHYSLNAADRGRSGSSLASNIAPHRIRTARRMLAGRNAWKPWPRRRDIAAPPPQATAIDPSDSDR
jgi:hypothetical protein